MNLTNLHETSQIFTFLFIRSYCLQTTHQRVETRALFWLSFQLVARIKSGVPSCTSVATSETFPLTPGVSVLSFWVLRLNKEFFSFESPLAYYSRKAAGTVRNSRIRFKILPSTFISTSEKKLYNSDSIKKEMSKMSKEKENVSEIATDEREVPDFKFCCELKLDAVKQGFGLYALFTSCMKLK